VTRRGGNRPGAIALAKSGLKFGHAAAHRAAVRPQNGALVCDPQQLREPARSSKTRAGWSSNLLRLVEPRVQKKGGLW